MTQETGAKLSLKLDYLEKKNDNSFKQSNSENDLDLKE